MLYVKPVQTGTALGHSDENFCKKYCSTLSLISLKQVGTLQSSTLYTWGDPVSPHVAATREAQTSSACDAIPTDSDLSESISTTIHQSQQDTKVVFVETAGGVLSPGPTGATQGDVYKGNSHLQNVILVGDGRLGGISSTLCAFESLKQRGFNIRSLFLIETDPTLGNHEYLSNYFIKEKVPVLKFSRLPPNPNEPLLEWYNDRTNIGSFKQALNSLVLEESARK